MFVGLAPIAGEPPKVAALPKAGNAEPVLPKTPDNDELSSIINTSGHENPQL